MDNGKQFFFPEKGACDRACVCVRKCSTDGIKCSGFKCMSSTSEQTIQDNKVSEKCQIIVSVSSSLLPFTGLP